jgi:hypothetical protein
MNDNEKMTICGDSLDNVGPIDRCEVNSVGLDNRQLAILMSVINRELGFDRVAALEKFYPNDAAAILPALNDFIKANP